MSEVDDPRAGPDRVNELMDRELQSLAKERGIREEAFAAKGELEDNHLHFFVMLATVPKGATSEVVERLRLVLARTGLEGTTTSAQDVRNKQLRDLLAFSLEKNAILVVADEEAPDCPPFVVLSFLSRDENRVHEVHIECEKVVKLG